MIVKSRGFYVLRDDLASHRWVTMSQNGHESWKQLVPGLGRLLVDKAIQYSSSSVVFELHVPGTGCSQDSWMTINRAPGEHMYKSTILFNYKSVAWGLDMLGLQDCKMSLSRMHHKLFKRKSKIIPTDWYCQEIYEYRTKKPRKLWRFWTIYAHFWTMHQIILLDFSPGGCKVAPHNEVPQLVMSSLHRGIVWCIISSYHMKFWSNFRFFNPDNLGKSISKICIKIYAFLTYNH